MSIIVKVMPTRLPYIREMARKAEIGGKSQIRGEDRQSTLKEDQLVGQICVFAFHLYWFGDVKWWAVDRWYRNQNPYQGDNGHDVPCLNVDVKGSMLRNGNNPDNYHLVVRPKEKHPGWIYVLAIAQKPNNEALEPWLVHLVGWANDNELPKQPDQDGVFSGAYTLDGRLLHPFPALVWDYS